MTTFSATGSALHDGVTLIGCSLKGTPIFQLSFLNSRMSWSHTLYRAF